RLFTSEVHDKPWYNDREMWPQYLTMLAMHRFNRFNLSFGIGYDFLQNVTDAYFLFTYPFLLAVPGYNVRVPQLPDAERDSNLAILKFISEQTVARGMDFQLGLWMHGYKWLNSPHPNYTIEGLDAENHGAYCRDALRLLLTKCPAISGVTFRIHGESGVEEGSFDFWKKVFDGVATCGRKVEIDMHAKGMNEGMLKIAVATGMPVKVSPKYWAEHLGMPYNQAEIRELERPKGQAGSALMKYSAGSRSFLRYGYGDLLREDRKWGVLTRIWPGTQRLLLWGDPVTAAAHAKAFGFCGGDGVEICEPLSFKGRRGSGVAGDRCGYADASLQTRWDWQKYEYTYRVWGRLIYNPEADPDQWQRMLRRDFRDAARPAELALANASRILPIVTTAYCPSAANNIYWPELYTNQSIVTVAKGEPYGDTPSPKVFGNASPLDPQLFSRVNDFADGLLAGRLDGKYSPVEVAQWLEDYAAAAMANLQEAAAKVSGENRPEYRRLAIDVSLQAGLGKFFAAKLRAGVLYRIHELTQSRTALQKALDQYREARAAWAELANRAKGVYVADITVGEHPQLRGHWLDRLPAIDADIENMRRKLDSAGEGDPGVHTDVAIREALARPHRVQPALRHQPPAPFRPGRPLEIQASLPPADDATVHLFHRRVDQAERWVSTPMESRGGNYRALVPADYTQSPFPLQYYFEVRKAGQRAALHPGFAPELNNQPYYVIRQA
ncbi:MAG TPA: hypothetical protein DEQ47_13990, partial [Solibacterales bacterium]|nr:hypothetical protein [Bryobacterales bacterium]